MLSQSLAINPTTLIIIIIILVEKNYYLEFPEMLSQIFIESIYILPTIIFS